jgi:hypothetical protein
MAFLGFKKKYDGRLVVLTYEGPGRLLLNGNRIRGKHAKRNAAAHPGTVCWIELVSGGVPLDQGVGPAASRLNSGEAERLLRELLHSSCCRTILEQLDEGRDHSCRWLELTRGQTAASGPSLGR